jgi:SAM-dependent methyltransferase
MAVELGMDALRIARTWSDAEFEHYKREIEAKRRWGYYHHIIIEDAAGKRLETPGTHECLGVIRALDRHGFPASLVGKTVLDIGCNAGFYSNVSKIRGATRVVGLDQQEDYIAQALLIREILGSDIDFRVADGHSLDGREGTFDFVINTGIIYHLQNPIDFLTKIAAITRELMYLETEALLAPELTEYAWFIEGEYGRDPSNWWIYGPRCVERMARAAGFARVEFQGYVWTPPPGTKTPEGWDRQGRAAFLCWKA